MQTLLLQNARLIDGFADQLRANVSTLVTGDRGGVAYDPQALLAQAPKSDFIPAS